MDRVYYYKQIITQEETNILKGIAILLVVICHIGNQFTRLLSPLGGIGVCLFLMLSSYGLEKSFMKSGLKAFWRKRLITVFVPYWLIELFAYSIGLIKFRGGVFVTT